MPELTNDQLNQRLAELLGLQKYAYGDSEMDFATDIAAALWVFREAGRQTDLACEKLWNDGEEATGEQLLYWLLMGDTERLLAEAAYAALREWREAHNE